MSIGKSSTDWQVDPFFLNLNRPKSPNNYLIAPKGFPGGPDEPSPCFPVGVAPLRAAFEEAVGTLAGVRGEPRHGAISHYLDETFLCRFKDDIHIQFIELGGDRSTFAAYSASRVGYWDFGKNRRRLRKWLALVRQRLGM